jgi:LuxR family quorum-sensing system transcriptional regulator CciR
MAELPTHPLDCETLAGEVAAMQACQSLESLRDILVGFVARLGLGYFVLTQHIHPARWSTLRFGLHNCPDHWLKAYAGAQLYKHDPILAACTRTNVGFAWTELPDLIDMTPQRQRVLAIYRDAGVGEGVTIPAHVAGEISGSCNFATRAGIAFPADKLLYTEMFGAFAYQTARRLTGSLAKPAPDRRGLTPRQRDCLLWAMRGKTDWEIGQILAISPETVTQHLEMARLRYGVAKRMQLAVRAIYLGDIGFDEAID